MREMQLTFHRHVLHFERYLTQYKKKELVEVCELLDVELMRHFDYRDCDSVLNAR